MMTEWMNLCTYEGAWFGWFIFGLFRSRLHGLEWLRLFPFYTLKFSMACVLLNFITGVLLNCKQTPHRRKLATITRPLSKLEPVISITRQRIDCVMCNYSNNSNKEHNGFIFGKNVPMNYHHTWNYSQTIPKQTFFTVHSARLMCYWLRNSFSHTTRHNFFSFWYSLTRKFHYNHKHIHHYHHLHTNLTL